MSTVQRFAKNVSFLYAANVINRILNLVLFIYIARYLGDTGLGQYSFILAFVGLFSIIHTFGFNPIISRSVARDKEKASTYVSNVVILRMGLFVITTLLIAVSINLLGYPQRIVKLVYLYMIASYLTSISTAFRALFIAYEKMEYEAFLTTANRLITVPLTILALVYGYGLEGAIAVLLLSGVFDFLISLFIANTRIKRIKFELDIGLCRKLFALAMPFVFLGVFNTIYHSVDIVMLSKIAGDSATGWYNAAYRLLNALLFVPAVFMGALFPVMSRFFASSRDSLVLAYRKSFQYLLMLALPLAVGVTLLADRIIIRIYGDVFVNSIAVLQILAWSTALVFLNNVFLTTLMSINRERTNTKILASGVILNVVLNFLLIPKYLHIGASIATLVAEVTFFVLASYSLARSLHFLPIHKLAFKPVIATLAMAAFVLYLREIITLFVVIPMAAVLYFAVLFLIHGFSGEDLELVKKIGG
jgi:O-antigen/teichoic acid export membrane protein